MDELLGVTLKLASSRAIRQAVVSLSVPLFLFQGSRDKLVDGQSCPALQLSCIRVLETNLLTGCGVSVLFFLSFFRILKTNLSMCSRISLPLHLSSFCVLLMNLSMYCCIMFLPSYLPFFRIWTGLLTRIQLMP